MEGYHGEKNNDKTGEFEIQLSGEVAQLVGCLPSMQVTLIPAPCELNVLML